MRPVRSDLKVANLAYRDAGREVAWATSPRYRDERFARTSGLLR
jgi:hypothetical protein